MPKMYFNRLHLNVTENERKDLFILDGIRSEASAGFNDYSYKIVDVFTYENYIMGYLIKYDPYGRGEVLDETTGTVRRGGTINNIGGKSLFIINTTEMVIAFEEIKNVISKIMFERMFLNLFKTNHQGKTFEFFISTISEKYSFIEKVKKLNNINRVSIMLVPSNPNNADLWRDTDERMQENNITKYKEIQESSNENGIIIDDETIAKMAMSEDGYGVASAQGIDEDGNPMTITTTSKEQEITQVLPENVERGGLPGIINYLSRTFERIRIRTSHQ